MSGPAGRRKTRPANWPYNCSLFLAPLRRPHTIAITLLWSLPVSCFHFRRNCSRGPLQPTQALLQVIAVIVCTQLPGAAAPAAAPPPPLAAASHQSLGVLSNILYCRTA